MLALTCGRCASSKTASASWNSVAAGARSPFGWRKKFPDSQIIGCLKFSQQKEHIDAEADRCGPKNLTVHHAGYELFRGGPEHFDRVVSMEMFEHMKNYQALHAKSLPLACSGGKLFRAYFHPPRCMPIITSIADRVIG